MKLVMAMVINGLIPMRRVVVISQGTKVSIRESIRVTMPVRIHVYVQGGSTWVVSIIVVPI